MIAVPAYPERTKEIHAVWTCGRTHVKQPGTQHVSEFGCVSFDAVQIERGAPAQQRLGEREIFHLKTQSRCESCVFCTPKARRNLWMDPS